MGDNKKYWNGLEELQGGAALEQIQKDEFVEDLPLENALSEDTLGGKSNRRDFLKIFGFGLTAATLAACETPLKKAIPYVNKPESITPGIANYYASTCSGCAAGCGIVVKTREGRPIKIEGNEKSHSKGGVCGTGQASVLSLYDAQRLREPRDLKSKISWAKADEDIAKKIGEVKSGGGKLFLVTKHTNSSSGKAAISAFTEKHGAVWIPWESVSYSAIVEGHNRVLGAPVVPDYHFDKAEVIISMGADFLGTWLSPVEFTKAYVKGRKVNRDNPSMSKHIQFESRVSLTGSNADMRYPVPAAKEGIAVMSLYNKVASKVGGAPIGAAPAFDVAGNAIENAANELVKAKGKSIVVSGSNDPNIQEVVAALNNLLGNFGNTMDVAKSRNIGGPVPASDPNNSLDKLANGDGVIFVDCNPVYDHPNGKKLAGQIKAAKLSVSITTKEDETSEQCQYGLPNHHFLESWNDHHPKAGLLTLTQPVIRPIFESRQAEETLLAWSGNPTSYYEFIRNYWRDNYSKYSTALTFDEFWNTSVQTGVFEFDEPARVIGDVPPTSDINKAGAEIAAEANSSKGMNLVIYESITVRNGEHANNPWLQETPDPISKITWENFVSIPYLYAVSSNLKDGDVVKLSVPGGLEVELPVYVQPGQAANTLAVGLGYGRTKGGKVADGVGKNVFPFVKDVGGSLRYNVAGAEIKATGANTGLAKTQTFTGYELTNGTREEFGSLSRGNIEHRVKEYIVKETTLEEYKHDRTAGNKNRPSKENFVTLWKDHPKQGYHWAMAIDLNACTGCGSCIVACTAENNIPVVGKDEVRRRREMHWIRIDRYFTGNPDLGENPKNDGEVLQLVHQPMLCQHCDNAPCETVCPVLATMHSIDGLNQQAYNRCIGTRYCANNCPYKVRRFNWFSYYDNSWFDYNMNDQFGKLVLNPDVTVRARGTMEKCSFCIQRIQEKKLVGRTEGRRVFDNEIKTACQQSCPADAIVFGDINDPNSEVHKLWRNERAFHALEDVKTLPGIAYLTKVRNNKPSGKKEDHHS